MFWFGLMAQIVVFGGVSFGSPILAIHLGSYEGFTRAWIGFYFSAPAITYMINSLFIGYICERVHRRLVLLIGLILFSLSLYIPEFIGYENNCKISKQKFLLIMNSNPSNSINQVDFKYGDFLAYSTL